MTERIVRRQDAHKALLDMFSGATGLPVGLFERHDSQLELTLSDGARERFEPHCQFIRQFPEGARLCDSDECSRAQLAIDTREEQLKLCHAGLYNQAMPIKVDGEIRGVLIYGEMQIEGEEYQRASLEKHRQAVERLGLGPQDAARLRELLLSSKKFTPSRVRELRSLLPRVEGWFYTLFDEEEQLRRSTDQVSHELQTRLQAVIANAENLVMECQSLSKAEILKLAKDILFSTLALTTLTQNLGPYLEDYDFRRQSIGPLVYEAKRIYEAEAARRGIEIRTSLQEPQKYPVMISRSHMQHTLNNLTHNAVKYSFRSGQGRQRFVKVEGFPEETGYVLEFSNFGVGILEDEIASGAIFRDGYQGKLTQGEYRTGSGKGLHFVKNIIDHHRGSLRVESKQLSDETDPEGQPHLTRLTIVLPYERAEEISTCQK